MAAFGDFNELGIDIGDDGVALVEIQRPPNNFFSYRMISGLADAFEALDGEASARAIVLAAAGKHFCAGADFSGNSDAAEGADEPGALYREAVRLFSTKTPVVAAIQGAAVGGGLGLALMPDFRVAAPEARFTANFARLGFHHGFGLSATLPRVVGMQNAMELLYTGKRIKADEALDIGMVDKLVATADLRDEARALAAEIAKSAPLAVRSIRETMRGDLAQLVKEATDHELEEQDWLRKTNDFKIGIRAYAAREDAAWTST